MLESSSLPAFLAHKRVVVIAAVLALGGALGGYAVHEYRSAQKLAAENEQTAAELNATRHQVSDLTAKVNMLVSRSEAQSYAPAQTATAPRSAATRRHSDDPRFKKLQSQIDAQNEAINQTRSDLASTQGDLNNTRTELTGSIAHTHDELVLLEKKGERNYAEFDISKSKQFQREGPIEIRLKKADNRHQFADLELLVDDRNLSQKHVNLYQPVMYSTPDSPQPLEIVINSISKDHIHGYVSAPKYRQSELASMSNTADNTADQISDATASSEQPAPRQKLPKPQ
jgi:chromosome segregation ATPase